MSIIVLPPFIIVLFVIGFGTGYECYNYLVFIPGRNVDDDQVWYGIFQTGVVTGNIMFFTGAAAIFFKITGLNQFKNKG